MLFSHLHGCFPGSFTIKVLYAFLLSPILATYPVYYSLLDLYMSQSSSLCLLP